MIEHCQYAMPSPLNTDSKTARDAFLTGRVAMVELWTDLGMMADDPSRSLIRNDWGVVSLPKGSGPQSKQSQALNGGFSLGISQKAPHARLAESFLLFASQPDVAEKLVLLNGGIDPTRKSILHSSQYRSQSEQVSQATQKSLYQAIAWPTDPNTPELLEILTEYLVMAIEHRISAENALINVQRLWVELKGEGFEA